MNNKYIKLHPGERFLIQEAFTYIDFYNEHKSRVDSGEELIFELNLLQFYNYCSENFPELLGDFLYIFGPVGEKVYNASILRFDSGEMKAKLCSKLVHNSADMVTPFQLVYYVKVNDILSEDSLETLSYTGIFDALMWK